MSGIMAARAQQLLSTGPPVDQCCTGKCLSASPSTTLARSSTARSCFLKRAQINPLARVRPALSVPGQADIFHRRVTSIHHGLQQQVHHPSNSCSPTRILRKSMNLAACNIRTKFGKKGVRRRPGVTKAAAADVSIATELPAFLPEEIKLIEDPMVVDMAKRIRRLPVKTSLAAAPIESSFVGPEWAGRSDGPQSGLPIVLLAGFDSSCLEYRKLLPQLERDGAEVWAVDLLGWGFSSATEGKGPAVSSFGPAAKREHLYSFWKTYIKRPMVLVGASLGGAVAVDLAIEHSDAVDRLVLMDAQVFIDGVGNKTNLPRWAANAGVQFLRSWPLRAYASTLCYYDRSIATKAATQAGRLHCLMPGWPDAMMSFMSSGGYSLTGRLPQLDKPSLVLWGRQDRVLAPTYALRFEKELARSKLEWVEDCGHLPHVERPDVVAQHIQVYIKESV